MTYELCKKLIEAGKTLGLQDKIDVFLLANRITEEQYQTLVAMIGGEDQ